AAVVSIVGAKSRDRARPMFDLPQEFGRKGTVGVDEKANLVIRTIGGRTRLITYLWHPTGMTGPKDFRRSYPTHYETISSVAQGLLEPALVTLS
ncbi:MAG: hypothetical protein ACRD0V_13595, partial [Acidimicrobiales bacterium]